MSQLDESWSANSNDALEVSLVTPSPTGLKTVASFNPKFTYSIFGDSERIFGYRDLKINLRYNKDDMRPNLTMSFSKKFTTVGDTEPANIGRLLQPYLPQVAFQKQKDFEDAIEQVPSDWTPPGQLIAQYDGKDGSYEVWKSQLSDPATKQLVSRIQVLVPLHIEGGMPIDTEEPDMNRWTAFFLYRKQQTGEASSKSSYTFAGYCTVYRFFLYQPPTVKPTVKEDLDLGDGNFDLAQLPCRSRISQFLVIPPFQGRGHGVRLYKSIFAEYLNHQPTVEITVEDPNEAFDDMRDFCDLTFLRTVPEFAQLRINTKLRIDNHGVVPRNIVDPKASEALRRKYKIAPRQFARVLEMHLMTTLHEAVRPAISPEKSTSAKATEEQKHEYNLWRLLVKTRLYRQNRDTLGQLDLPERIEKLVETLGSVELEYARLVAIVESREQFKYTDIHGVKRKMIEAEQEAARKKARLESMEVD